MNEAQAYIKKYKENKFLPSVNFEGDLLVSEKQLAEMLQEFHEQQLSINDVSKCNSVKDPNIIKTYAFITNKDGSTDVWHKGECLGKGLDAEGINALNLRQL